MIQNRWAPAKYARGLSSWVQALTMSIIAVLCAGANAMPFTGVAMQQMRLGGPAGRSSAPATLQRSNSALNPVAPMQRGSMDLFAVSDNSQCTASDRSQSTAPAQAVLSQPTQSAGGQPQTQLCYSSRCDQGDVTPVPASAPAAAHAEKHTAGIAVMRGRKMFLMVRLLVLWRAVEKGVPRCYMLVRWLHLGFAA